MISFIEKISGRRKIATLTLSSLIKTGQREILPIPRGIVLMPNISARSIQNTYIPVRIKSLYSDLFGWICFRDIEKH